VSEFVFGTHNAAFVQVMYEQYLRDPASVGEEWRQLFDNGRLAELPVIPTEPIGSAWERGAGSGTLHRTGRNRCPLPAPGLNQPNPDHRPRCASRAEHGRLACLYPPRTSFREITVDVLDARRRELNAQLAAAARRSPTPT